MTRAERRHRLELAKKKAIRVIKHSWGRASVRFIHDPRFVAKMAETHCRPCSCYGCARETRPQSEAA